MSARNFITKSIIFQTSILSLFFAFAVLLLSVPSSSQAQTSLGELEGRAAPVYLRRCLSGSSAGALCKQNSDCPGSSCPDRNVFNIQVAISFSATATQLTAIENMITAGSASLFDATDGQAEIGTAFIYNNQSGSGDHDVRVHPSSTPVWWNANTGGWQVGGDMEVDISRVNAAISAGNVGEIFAHELLHLAFDPRDEYESRASGCGSIIGSDACPAAATVAAEGTGEQCIMDSGGSELCWGQADPSDLTDLSGGNHDANNTTEQSVCRSNRSCWDQVVWSYPNTFLHPGGAPDPAANGATVNPVNFVHLANTNRVVLVLDESESMNQESPTRMERLQVAANDFIGLAENGTELGIVSFSSDADPASGHANVPISALGTSRTTWTNAVSRLSSGGLTNIGDALGEAWDLIDAAGGVTANTYIVLMTDGVNNQPTPQSAADADLQDQIDFLLSVGVPVYVTCTGGDLTLASQCAEIGNGTGGFYSDSGDTASLPPTFAAFHEKGSGREAIYLRSGLLSTARPQRIFVEKDSESVTFLTQWENSLSSPYLLVVDPLGKAYKTWEIDQGRYVRISNPMSGDWKLLIDHDGVNDSKYVTSAFSKNSIHRLKVGARYATVEPGQPITIFAYPDSYNGPVSNPRRPIFVMVETPNGRRDRLLLWDQGRKPGRLGDDVADDGVYTGVYKNTRQRGTYRFTVFASIYGWRSSGDAHKINRRVRSPRFNRIASLSVGVSHPNDVTRRFEDQPERQTQQKKNSNQSTTSSSRTTSVGNKTRPAVFDIVGKGRTELNHLGQSQ